MHGTLGADGMPLVDGRLWDGLVVQAFADG